MSHDHLGNDAEELYDALRDVAYGGEEFKLVYYPKSGATPAVWWAEMVNENTGVDIGEGGGKFAAKGADPLEAMRALRDSIRKEL